ncbi:MAG: hypothetical protein OEZ43_07600 [Gammaproteobacteria bacterium]|nr:hypothetical protein [Gammaproteobacteria bacterium]
MNSNAFEHKSAYQIRREKAGTRGGLLVTILVLLILAANIDSVFAASTPHFKITSMGYNLDKVRVALQEVKNAEFEYYAYRAETGDMSSVSGSDVVVMDGINDLSAFIDMVERMPEAIIVVVGDSLIGQGLMLDNLIVTHAFVADDTVVAILKMKAINPQLRQAQLLHGIFGESVYDQIAFQQQDIKPVDVEQAVRYANMSLENDFEAPRGYILQQGAQHVIANVEDNRAVSYVELYIDNRFVSRDYEAPYEFDVSDIKRAQFIAYDTSANSSRLGMK